MTRINELGTTAFVIATVRAGEPDRHPPLFSDPGAEWFVSPHSRVRARQLEDAFPPVVDIIRFRTCYFDRFVERGIRAGARQVVLLGCGLDMRAHRLATPGVTFFEVDQEAVLVHKARVLAEHGLEQAASLHCNYLEADVPGGLAKLGCDLYAPTLVAWEGNTMYVPRAALFAFVNRLAGRMPAMRLGLDYFRIDLDDHDSGTEKARRSVRGIESAMGAAFPGGLADITMFERETPLRITETGSFAGLAREFGAGHIVDAYPEECRDSLDVFRYCALERGER